MDMNNEIHLRFYAEDHIRVRLLEAENYQMLNQLREHCPKGISLGWHDMSDRLGCSLIALEEKLEDISASLATWFDYEGKMG